MTKNEQANEVEEVVLDKVLTVPNIITFCRLLLVPVFAVLLFVFHKDIAALIVFVVASCTDWVDGQVARRTGQVSRLGKLFDPVVDRVLLATGVISLTVLNRVPLWILVLLLIREVLVLLEGRLSLKVLGSVPAVSYVGKFATAFLMVGYAFLLLGMPLVDGLGVVDVAWLPGFGSQQVLVGMWFVYIGMVFSIAAFFIYQVRGFAAYFRAKAAHLI